MRKIVRIGTRKSKLAMIQTGIVIDRLKAAAPELEFEIIPISTLGDEVLDKPLLQFGGKGVFVDAFEGALLKNEIDLAVHSAKDMTMQLPEGLGILGVLEREDARDVLVTFDKELDPDREAVIGTSSLRRQIQIKRYYNAQCKSLRGNVPTRLEKLKSNEYDGIILAAAGLKRLGLMEEKPFQYRIFSAGEFVPAAGQGIIAMEGRVEDELAKVVSRINNSAAAISLSTERRVLELLDAGCHEAIGVYSMLEGNEIIIHAIYQRGNTLLEVRESASVHEYMTAAERVAHRLAE